MSDLKLFSLRPDGVTPLRAETVALERSLQSLMEANLDALLGVRFLETEYVTGKKHAGRIDTLGVDENGCPVIIEYKRRQNENVINQGLYYLDWLLDHRAEFELLVMRKLGNDAAGSIDWSSPRLMCIAGGFTKYDVHAVAQINRNIELIRYAKYGDALLLLDLVNRTEASTSDARASASPSNSAGAPQTTTSATPTTPRVDYQLEKMVPELREVWRAFEAFVAGLGDEHEVTRKDTKVYIAFRRLKNFVCVRPTSKHLTLWVRLDPESVALEPGFTRDVREIGHYGTGDLEVTVASLGDLEKAKPLLERAFEEN